MKAAFVIVAAVATAGLVSANMMVHDHCSQYKPCQPCVAHPLCGWCSQPVVYKDGTVGAQCAGFNANGSRPFICPGQYSTEMCVKGYKCNQATFQCELTKAGEGSSKMDCERNCTNNGDVYKCNHTSKTCHVVPPGTPGSSALAVCEAACIHPSAHPSSSSPAPQPNSTLFACNTSTGKCESAAAGKGSSKAQCEKTCTNTNGKNYYCNLAVHKCMELPPGQPGGESQKQCESVCVPPKPKPNPPPSFKTGLYRGIEVQKGYKTGEFDLDVNVSSVTMVSMYEGEAPVTVTGLPFHMGGSNNLIIKLTSGADSGKYIYTYEFAGGQPGPETSFLTIAFSVPGATGPPASIHSAWNTAGQKVYALAACLSADCLFTLPAGKSSSNLNAALNEIAEAGAPITDICSKYSADCVECVNAHKFCGWCSVNVTYQGGTIGTQCAGFNGPKGEGQPFVCPGHYSTYQCNQGYVCDETTYQCKAAPAGNGHPKEVCEVLCKPTPPPTPLPNMYVCNSTLKTCHKCTDRACPGGLPEGPCMAGCVHPKKGPHAKLIGSWRGIYIQLDYKRIEVEFTFTNTSLEVFNDKKFIYSANITSYGSDAMKMKIVKGENVGYTFGATFQYESIDAEYEMMTYARGVFGESFPASYNAAMKTGGMEVLVMAKCQGPPCSFPVLSP